MKSISRRTVLRGTGAAIALPFLDAMVPAFTALARAQARPRTRFGAIYVPNGAIMEQWIPERVGVEKGSGKYSVFSIQYSVFSQRRFARSVVERRGVSD
jgi:hypothetical protein